jgi:hypothetical protein
MTLKSKIIAPVILVVIFGGIALASLLGMWNTVSSKEPALITSGDAVGMPDPADIRGSYTLNDITKAFNVPTKDLKTAFRLPADTDPASFQIKELETIFETESAAGTEIGAGSVRLFIAFFTGLPIDTTTDTYLPPEAVELLKSSQNLTAEQVQYLDTHIAGGGSSSPTEPPAAAVESTTAAVESPAVPADGEPTATSSKEEQAVESKQITGKTTFQQLLDWGVPKEAIETVINDILPEPSTLIKDYFSAKGLEFLSFKTTLQTEVDKTK